MSAVLRDAPRLVRMQDSDLAEVMAIESEIYSHPWTRGNFGDSLRAGYQCWTWRLDTELLAYFVLLVAAGEAHLLNLSVAAHAQSRGHGRTLLDNVAGVARSYGAKILFLEVRPSNEAGQRLYAGYGFKQVGVRRSYYPARRGREDALVLSLAL